MQWSEKLSVGNLKIDSQHKKLLDTLNNHFEACTQRKGNEEIIKTLDFLEKYVVIHFRDEEEYLAKNNYPQLEQHKAIHKRFLDKVFSLVEKVKDEGVSLPVIIDINTQLNDLLVNHIMQTDKAYYRFFNGEKK